MMWRSAIAGLLVVLATLYTPAQALFADCEPFLAGASLVVGLLFAGVALWGRGRIVCSRASTREALTAVYRAKRILWIWAGLGGAVLVLSLSSRDASSMDEAFGMIGFGWLIAGLAALLLESVAFTHEDALGEPTEGA